MGGTVVVSRCGPMPATSRRRMPNALGVSGWMLAGACAILCAVGCATARRSDPESASPLADRPRSSVRPVGPWTTCNEVRQRYVPPQRPKPIGRSGPIVAGEVVPLYSLDRSPPDAQTLSDRAMLLACALKGPDIRGDIAQLHEWATASTNDATSPSPSGSSHRATPFSDPALQLSYLAWRDEIQLRDAGVVSPRVDPDQLDSRHGPDAGIGKAAAADRARSFAEAMEATGLITPRTFDWTAPTTRVRVMGLSRHEKDPGVHWIRAYTFTYGLVLDGIPVLGGWREVTVDRGGKITAVGYSDVEITSVGTAVAAISEEEAAQLWDKLVTASGSNGIKARGHGTGVAYVPVTLDGRGPCETVPPVWYGGITCVRDQFISNNGSWGLSLADPERGLIQLSTGLNAAGPCGGPRR